MGAADQQAPPMAAESWSAGMQHLERVAACRSAEEVRQHMGPLQEVLSQPEVAEAVARQVLLQVQQAQQGSESVACAAQEAHSTAADAASMQAACCTDSAEPALNGQSAALANRSDLHGLLNGCRMVRAMCLASQCQALAAAGVAPILLSLLTGTQATDEARGAAAEALLSLGLRHSCCVGDALAASGESSALALLALLTPSPAAADESVTTPRPCSVAVLRLTIHIAGHHRGAMAVLLKAGLLRTLLQLARGSSHSASGSPASPPPASTKPHGLQLSLCRMSLNFLVSLSSVPHSHPSLLAAGCPAVMVALLVAQAAQAEGGSGAPADVCESAASVLSNLALGGKAAQDAILAAGGLAPLVAALGSRHIALAAAAADALANVMLHNAAARLQLAATRLHVPGTPAGVGRNSDVTTSTDASSSSRQRHQLGGLHALTRLLHSTQVPLLVKALRALSNAVIGCPSNQAALVSIGVIPALVKLCEPSLPPLITRQALGALGNCVGGCAAAQQAALATGVAQVAALHLQLSTSASSQNAGSRSMSTTNGTIHDSRDPAAQASEAEAGGNGGTQATSAECAERACLLLANLCAAGPSAKAAVVGAGVLPLLLGLTADGVKCAALSSLPASASATAQENGSPSQVQGGADATSTDGQAAKAKAGPQQQQQQQQQAAQIRAAVAAVNALGNLVLHAPAQQAAATEAGAPLVLVTALRQAAAEPELVVAATQALGSLVMGCPGAGAQAVEAGVLPTLMAIIEARPPLTTLVPGALRALGHLASSGGVPMQQAVGAAGGVRAVTGALTLPSAAIIKAALLTLIALVDGCPQNQKEFISDSAGVASLARLLRVRGEDLQARACLILHVLAAPPSARQRHGSPGQGRSAAPQPSIMLLAGSEAAGPGGEQEGEVTLAVQRSLASAGVIPALVRLLHSPSPEVADKAVMALCALVHNCRENQVLTAAAGGITSLAALIETALAPGGPASTASSSAPPVGSAPPNPSSQPHPSGTGAALSSSLPSSSGALMGGPQKAPLLSRHVLDTFIELGGPMALVKLLHSRYLAASELAARRICALLDGTASGLGSGSRQAGGTQQAQALQSLLKAGVVPALLQAAARSSSSPRLIEASIAALELMLRVGGSDIRQHLVREGAADVLQELVTAAAGRPTSGRGTKKPASSSGRAPGTHQAPSHGQPPPHGRARSPGPPPASVSVPPAVAHLAAQLSRMLVVES